MNGKLLNLKRGMTTEDEEERWRSRDKESEGNVTRANHDGNGSRKVNQAQQLREEVIGRMRRGLTNSDENE